MTHINDIMDLSTSSVSSTFDNNNAYSSKNNSPFKYFDNVSLAYFFYNVTVFKSLYIYIKYIFLKYVCILYKIKKDLCSDIFLLAMVRHF